MSGQGGKGPFPNLLHDWYPRLRVHKEGGETPNSVAGGDAPRHLEVMPVLPQTHQQESSSWLVPKGVGGRHGWCVPAISPGPLEASAGMY